MKFGYSWPGGFGEIFGMVKICALGLWSKNDLDILYSQIFMY